MCKFIHSESLKSISDLIKNGSEGIFAVAFWGENAFENLGLNKREPSGITIICDLMSGACNPSEIKKLRKAHYTVKRLDHLHAKVFWTPQKAYIGSANASANALGFEGTELGSNFEAGVICSEAMLLNRTKAWLDTIVSKAVDISEDDLKSIQEKWENRRRSRDRFSDYGGGVSLLEQFQKDPSFLKDKRIFVDALDEDYSAEGKKVFEQARRDYGKNIDGYELETSELSQPAVKAGSYVIQVWVKDDKPECNGLFKISEEIERQKMKNGNTFVFMTKMRTFDRARFTNKDKAQIERRVKAKLDGGKSVPFVEALEEFLS